MNREQRRRIMKKIPKSKKILKFQARKAVENMENAFRKKWQEDDESLNYGENAYDEDQDQDEKFNY